MDAWLEQIQLCCPFDGRPAIRDVEFRVDALGMCANRAQGDYEFLGDLRPRKLGCEQSQHVKLTLAEWLDQGLRSGGGGERRLACAARLLSFTRCQQLAGVAWHDGARGSFPKQVRHG